MPKGPRQYEVVATPNTVVELEELVRAKISDGWEPLGGVAASHLGVLMQAMTKEGETLQDPR